MRLTIPPGQMKIVIPLLAVLAVALTMTVVRMRAAIEKTSAPAQGQATQAGNIDQLTAAGGGTVRPTGVAGASQAAVSRAASERNPFDPRRLAGASIEELDDNEQLQQKRRELSGLPPANVNTGKLAASLPGNWVSGQEVPKTLAMAQPEAQPMPVPEFKLNAIVQSSGASVAIISVGGSQLQAVREGQQVNEGYRVVYIGDGVVRLSSPGRSPVRLSLPGSEPGGGDSSRIVAPAIQTPPGRPGVASINHSTSTGQSEPESTETGIASPFAEPSAAEGNPLPAYPASPDPIQVIAQKSDEQYD